MADYGAGQFSEAPKETTYLLRALFIADQPLNSDSVGNLGGLVKI